ncbi:MAG: acyl transferase [Chitinophagaceae bacterium]|jgi:phenylacetate-coenzyme A ligase PaaK-like adenylate-forming protein|nr:acyl transferase [Chitinophagaceae bacterium]
MKETTEQIFSEGTKNENLVLSVFQHQYKENKVYSRWVDALNIFPEKINTLTDIPFFPISFFKTNKIVCGDFVPQQIFESSGTTATGNSRHFVKDIDIYKRSFVSGFEIFYGDIKNWCVIGLLPSYFERKNSSLIMMVEEMIKISSHPQSGFYLYDFDKLYNTLQQLENAGQKTLLIGVSFALLDFSEIYSMNLQHTIVMETGGMKGRRKELTRPELHDFLTKKLGVNKIHSEYGMTELLSQAYSKGNGKFVCPPWMQVVVRDEEDPMQVKIYGKGVLNIIDLANFYSCSFIATEDVGIVNEDGCFEVWGRLDNSDIRGCSLLVV